MEILEEKRKIKQIPIYDEDGRIDFYKIPNYTLKKEFITCNERIFMRTLINIIPKLNEKYKEYKVFCQISTQVALNRIIDKEIKNKSIDYVLYDLNTGKILCCIELDGTEHIENTVRKERDILLSKMLLKEVVKIIHIQSNTNYDEDEIIRQIAE